MEVRDVLEDLLEEITELRHVCEDRDPIGVCISSECLLYFISHFCAGMKCLFDYVVVIGDLLFPFLANFFDVCRGTVRTYVTCNDTANPLTKHVLIPCWQEHSR